MSDKERGLGRFQATIDEDAVEHLATVCDGDARRALAALEVAVLSEAERRQGLPIRVDLATASESIQRKAINYDGTGDAHYDAISAMIKSIRGSDPDAAVYWIARMLEAGEDPRFVARRLVILAAEDVGNADPHGLVLAQATAGATDFVGMPECQLPLAQAAIYLACAPKSNASAMAIWAASEDVKQKLTIPVPKHLRATGYRGAERLGHGRGYQYPHDAASGLSAQEYLGVDKVYYEPVDRGHESVIRRFLEEWRERKKHRTCRRKTICDRRPGPSWPALRRNRSHRAHAGRVNCFWNRKNMFELRWSWCSCPCRRKWTLRASSCALGMKGNECWLRR
jgi:putative ATPase